MASQVPLPSSPTNKAMSSNILKNVNLEEAEHPVYSLRMGLSISGKCQPYPQSPSRCLLWAAHT